MTAQIAVRMPDRFHDGLRPTHLVWLRENDVPGLTLIEVNHEIYEGPDTPRPAEVEWAIRPVRWLGSRPDQLIQDAMLMICLHVFKTPEMVEEAAEIAPELLKAEWLAVYKTDQDALVELHEICMDAELPGKLAVTVLGGSSLEGQLPLLAEYWIQMEVCTVTYSHTWGGFGGPDPSRAVRAGSLTASWSAQGPIPDRYRDVNFPTSLPGALQDEVEDDDD
jgi:hypothetical protein